MLSDGASPVTIGHEILKHRVGCNNFSDNVKDIKNYALKWKLALDEGLGKR